MALAFITKKDFLSHPKKQIRNLMPLFMKRDTTIPIKNNNILPGLAIGIPVNALSYTFTNLHYGYDIMNLNTVSLLFGLAFIAYNYDRTLDSIYSLNKPNSITDKKYPRHKYYYENIELYLSSNTIIFGLISYFFATQEIYLPFFVLLNSIINYRTLKTQFGELKSTYIAVCWCLASLVLPCVIHDNDYSILEYPLDYMPFVLTLFSYSNIADIKDIEEDKLNNVNTLPVRFGADNTKAISLFLICIASYLFAINPNFNTNILWNSFYEIGNIGYIVNEIIVKPNSSSNYNINNTKGNFDITLLPIMARFLDV